MRLLLIFIACLAIVFVGFLIFGLITGFVPGLIPLLILTTLLAAVVNNQLESRRINRELKEEGLIDEERS